MDSNKEINSIKTMVKNPAFILAKGIQRIRVLQGFSVKKINKDKMKSCEFYLNERKKHKKNVSATQNSIKSLYNNPSNTKVYRSQSNKDILAPIQSESTTDFLDKSSTSILGPYIKKFLSKQTKIKPISPIQTPEKSKSQTYIPSKVKNAINSIKQSEIQRCRSESIFNKLQISIYSELEKSVSAQKTLGAQIDSIKSLKKITDNFGRFKPTNFELKVLGGAKREYEIEKNMILAPKRKNDNSGPNFKNSIGNYSTISKYQTLYRQFNNPN